LCKMSYQNGFVKKCYYSIELKHKVCKEHIEEGIGLAKLVGKYKLSCHSLIHRWLRDLGYIACANRPRSAYIGVENFLGVKNKSGKKELRTPEQQEIELLKKQHEDARLQVEGYRRMIEIAETELKIPIRKKRNTK
jgi:transposase